MTNLIKKYIYKNPTATTLNDEELDAFPQRLGIRQDVYSYQAYST